MFRKSEKGFSLIELLVAVAILGLLAGVAVPRAIEGINRARTSADAANVSIIQSAFDRMAVDQNLRTLPRWRTALERPALALYSPVTIDTAMWTILEDYARPAVEHPFGGHYTVELTQVRAGAPVLPVVRSVFVP